MLLALLLATVPLINPPVQIEQGKVDAIWEFVQELTDSKVEEPPAIYFTTEDEPPLTGRYLAYWYANSRQVRVWPSAWRRQDGYGYIVLAHEMTHYALSNVRPVEEHHCYFVAKQYWTKTINWLIEKEWIHPWLVKNRDDLQGCDLSGEGNEN